MKNVDLRVLAVNFLKTESAKVKLHPHELTYSAKQVSVAVGGYAGALGQVARDVEADLLAMGIACKYYNNRKPTTFVLSLSEAFRLPIA
jgi:hypothetical protein